MSDKNNNDNYVYTVTLDYDLNDYYSTLQSNLTNNQIFNSTVYNWDTIYTSDGSYNWSNLNRDNALYDFVSKLQDMDYDEKRFWEQLQYCFTNKWFQSMYEQPVVKDAFEKLLFALKLTRDDNGPSSE